MAWKRGDEGLRTEIAVTGVGHEPEIPLVRRGLDPEAVRIRIQGYQGLIQTSNTRAEAFRAEAEASRTENARLRQENQTLQEEIERSKSQASAVGNALILAQTAADTLLSQARAEAAMIVLNATAEAETRIQDARHAIKEAHLARTTAVARIGTLAETLEEIAAQLRHISAAETEATEEFGKPSGPEEPVQSAEPHTDDTWAFDAGTVPSEHEEQSNLENGHLGTAPTGLANPSYIP